MDLLCYLLTFIGQWWIRLRWISDHHFISWFKKICKSFGKQQVLELWEMNNHNFYNQW